MKDCPLGNRSRRTWMTRRSSRHARQNSWARLEHALVQRCAERSCKLLIRKEGAHILKCDMLNPSMGLARGIPMSDFLVFLKQIDSFMLAVELKSGKLKVDKARTQLVNGARLAIRLAKELPDFRSGNVFLLLVANDFGNDLDQRRLKDPVSLNGAKYEIHTCSCGSKLSIMVNSKPNAAKTYTVGCSA